jgi:CRP/FNR family transcriptional regulator
MVVDLPLTREEMADYLGLTLETVSRQISALKKDGVITLEGKRHVTIPDFDRLLEEAGDDSATAGCWSDRRGGVRSGVRHPVR